MDLKNEGIYDHILLEILSKEGQVLPFIEAVFNFLYRRTDFFRVRRTPSDALGFDSGVAENMVKNVFLKYQKQREIMEKLELSAGKTTPQIIPAPSPVVEKTAPTNDITDSDGQKGIRTRDAMPRTVGSDEDQQRLFQECPESYNGARRDRYAWTQSIGDMDVNVPLPSNVLRRSQVRVVVRSEYLKVEWEVASEGGEFETVVEGALLYPVRADESVWTLTPGENLHIFLEKCEERWWEGLLVDEPKIDVQKIERIKPYEDLDEEAQAKLEQLAYDNMQKMQGKPTSEEQKMQSILRDAWDKDGSPFKGQPFNPSSVQLGSSNINM